MDKLPILKVRKTKPAFNDIETKTSLQVVHTLYGVMNELIKEYNSFAEHWNTSIDEFMTTSNGNYEEFKVAMQQQFQDFIDVVDLKNLEFTTQANKNYQEFTAKTNQNYNDFTSQTIQAYDSFTTQWINNFAEFTKSINQKVNDQDKSIEDGLKEIQDYFSSNIANLLGYTPARQEDVNQLSNQKVNGTGIKNIVKLTQAEYDNMASHDSETLYVIVG